MGKLNVYFAPELEIVEVGVEQGFAVSTVLDTASHDGFTGADWGADDDWKDFN